MNGVKVLLVGSVDGIGRLMRNSTLCIDAVLLGVLLFLLPSTQGYYSDGRGDDVNSWDRRHHRHHLDHSESYEYDEAYLAKDRYPTRRQGTGRVFCTSGYVYVGGRCRPTHISCPPYFTLINNVCTDSGGVTAMRAPVTK
uniref:Uncharacterized protein n=1 Tax=Timema douglasi TaxID=61478 RepID=A0A7R8VU37_TIMDO|nr:unnamed protein product [Timema douglasi]